jgi:predicted CXXCH cytochrome family protein
VALATVTAFLLFPSVYAAGVEHPMLPKVDGTACALCHEDLVPDQAEVHPPAAEDCTTCHGFEAAEGGMTVELADAEPALCLMCHDDKAEAVEGEVASPHYPVTESCLTCHDPHGGALPSYLTAAIPTLCSDCHDPADLAEVHKGQMTATTNCLSCHQPHGSGAPGMLRATRLHQPFADGSCSACHREPFAGRIRMRSRGSKLCVACHGEMDQAPEGGSSHAALQDRRGRAGCLNCHEPHLSEAGTLLKGSGPEVCERCHGGVVENAVSVEGHAPAAEDCGNCHEPHAGPEPVLLQASVGEICVMCHDTGDEELAGAHLQADLEALTCVSCHSPHGAGQPHLLESNVHAPIFDGCDTCHEGTATELAEGGESTLCLMCHDDVGEVAEAAAVPHPAMEMARCADCHNPHASKVARLVKTPGDEVCVTCHEDQGAREGEVAHGAIETIGCQACHEPHGGESPSMLRREGNDLCRSCHDKTHVATKAENGTVTVMDRFALPAAQARKMFTLELTEDGTLGHPVIGHRVAGMPTEDGMKGTDSSYLGAMSCRTCHDPHKGKSKLIFNWDARTPPQVCAQCHAK